MELGSLAFEIVNKRCTKASLHCAVETGVGVQGSNQLAWINMDLGFLGVKGLKGVVGGVPLRPMFGPSLGNGGEARKIDFDGLTH